MKHILSLLTALLLTIPITQAGLVIVGETVQRAALTPGATFNGTITIFNNGISHHNREHCGQRWS